MKAQVHVTLHPDILDPQGDAVRHALSELGFSDVRSVRVGKLIELELDDHADKAQVESKLRAMCDKLLANPVMESFDVKLLDTK